MRHRRNVLPRIGTRTAILLAVVAVGVLSLAQACTNRDVTAVPLGSVAVQPASASLVVGQSLPFSAVVKDDQGNTLAGAPVTWSSDTPTVVSVDSDGTAHALAQGSAVVRATFRDLTGTASVTVGPGPSILATPGEVTFSGTLGGAAASAIVVQVTNGGGGTLQGLLATVQYTSGQPAGWITASLGASSAPTSLTLTPRTAGLPAGSYAATVILSAQGASNSPLSVPVTLTLAEGRAIIGLDPATVDLDALAGGEPATADVEVTDTGGGSLTDLSTSIWYDAAGGGWLSASLSGTAAPAQLHLVADPTALSPGTYEAEVRVESPVAVNSPQPVSVTFVVSAAADLAITKSGPSSARAGDQVTYTLHVANNGPSTAEGVVVNDTLPPGTTLASASVGSLVDGVLQWDVGALTAGASVEATIVLDVPDGTTGTIRNVATVSATTPDPDPTDNVAAVSTDITANAGPAAAFTWATTNLSVTFTDASTDSDGSVDAWSWDFGDGSAPETAQNPTHAYAAAGDYLVTLTVTDNDGATAQVQHTVTVTTAPAIQLTPTTLTFAAVLGSDPAATQSLTVRNAGGGTLSWTATDDATWLSVSPSSGSLASGESTPVTVTVTSASLTAGNYTGTVTVSAPGATNTPQSATVSLTVTAPNAAPVAAFTWAATDLSVTFTDGSTDSDGSVVAWSWDFGDGSAAGTAQNPTHAYADRRRGRHRTRRTPTRRQATTW